MLNIIWLIIMITSITFATITARPQLVTEALMTSSITSVKLIIELFGILSIWCGIIKIAEESGLVKAFAKLIRPVLSRLFKGSKENDLALSNIVLNLTSNMIGVSNAATPFGIKAMENLQNANKDKATATDDMALFLVLNGACIQLLPTMVISMRVASHSKLPGEIILPSIITTAIAALTGVIACKILERHF